MRRPATRAVTESEIHECRARRETQGEEAIEVGLEQSHGQRLSEQNDSLYAYGVTRKHFPARE